jgi:hypothetical protein
MILKYGSLTLILSRFKLIASSSIETIGVLRVIITYSIGIGTKIVAQYAQAMDLKT